MESLNTPAAIFPVPLETSWNQQLASEFQQPYMSQLLQFLQQEWTGPVPIYPPKEQIFAALNATPFEQVRVVIIGQDPYHGLHQAHGLSFSVLSGVRLPPSLKNIYKELQNDLAIVPSDTGYLLPWAKQGVLMLNATLTVRAGQPRSHYGQGWEKFTDAIILKLAQRAQPLIVVLWGKNAQQKVVGVQAVNDAIAQDRNHIILKAAHPSPYSAEQGFFGCRHFSKINTALQKINQPTIDWQLITG